MLSAMAFGSAELLQALSPVPVSHPLSTALWEPQLQAWMVDRVLLSWRKFSLPAVLYSKETLKNTLEKKYVEKANGKSYGKRCEKGRVL